MNLLLGSAFENVKTIVCIGAHPDDIEIGCGGALLTLLKQNPQRQIHWVICTSNPIRKLEAEKSAQLFLKSAQEFQLHIQNFKDGFLPYQGEAVKSFFESLKLIPSPDLIFTHTSQDSHQDHRLVSELTWNTFRNHFILEYEIAKWEGDLSAKNFYIPITKNTMDEKIQYLHEAYTTQAKKDWFDAETFRGIARLRGLECRASEKYAESFIAKKITVDLG